MNEIVVYFSLNPVRKDSFYRYIKAKRICYTPKFSFALDGEKDDFRDPRDLIALIERTPKKDSLHIIIDYVSCCGTGEEVNFSTAIRDIIMCYPEVQFLFDETFVKKRNKERKATNSEVPEYSFMNFLFWKAVFIDISLLNVLAEFHQFDLGDYKKETVEEQFIRLLKGCNNMYDGSNLRHAIKWFKRDSLAVQSNYEKVQESRSAYVAVVVEEEYHQCMFNCYCLYASGFRVVPVVSATELLWMNETIDDKNHKNLFYCTEEVRNKKNGQVEEKEVGPLLVRDYDLQFVDEGHFSSNTAKKKEFNTNKGKKTINLNEIDWVRGAKAIPQEKDDTKIEEYVIIEKKDNPYWKAFEDERIYFVSKGADTIKIKSYYFEQSMSKEGAMLKIRGIEKPLEGVYASFREDIEAIRIRYDKSREDKEFLISRTGNNGHSCPLDIYGIARTMVHRAEDYCQNGCNRLAALVAGEALEVLNGFHRSLMNKAYFIQAVAENAMAMSLLGGDEGVLRRDVKFRLNQKVKTDVARMIPDEEYRYNLLYNIFNDCRLFCREKEYFVAADEALSVMVYEKEAISPADLFNGIVNKLNKLKDLIRETK